MSVIPVFLLAGDLNLSELIHYQTGKVFGFLPNWLIFKQPLAFAIFLVAAFAETNRLPLTCRSPKPNSWGYHPNTVR
jgi:NADH-quinone oxidoreductase subunit H